MLTGMGPKGLILRVVLGMGALESCAALAADPQADQAATAETIPAQPVQSAAEALPTAPAPAAGEATRLEDVVVTATKREKSLRDIPASISAYDGDKLESQGQTNLNDYVSQTPGVTMTQVTPNLPRISIRGISTDTSGLSGQPSPTGIFINDVAFTDPYISNMQPDLSAFDLSSVEILKGPQGTLFGGAALAGAVRYVLNDPQPGQWQARAFTQYRAPEGGSTALTSGFAANAPLYKDSLTLRLGYVTQEYPGITDKTRNPPRENVDSGEGEQIRGILQWQPWDELKIKLTHLQQDYATPDATTTADGVSARETDRIVLEQPVNTRVVMNSLDIQYDFDSMRLVSLTSKSGKEAHIFGDATAGLLGQPPPGYPRALAAFLYIDADSDAFAQELRLQSTGDGPFQWLAGAYLYNYSLEFVLAGSTIAQQQLLGNGALLDNLLNGVGLDSTFLFNESSLLYSIATPTAEERALFFDLSYKFWDRLELSAGARLYSTMVSGGFYGTGILARAGNMGQDINYTDNELTEKGVSPKFTATYHFTRDLSVYAQASRGFRFGGLQSIPSTVISKVPQQYQSDSLWNYEAGVRSAWLDNTLQLDLTVFYDVFKNPQLKQSTNIVPLSYTTNVGGALSQGLEGNMRWLTPLPGLQLNFGGALTDAHTTKPFKASNGDEVPPGTQMPGAAKYQYSGGMIFLAPIGSLVLGSTANYTYVGKGQSNIIDQVDINDYGTLNAGLSVTSDAWALRPTLTFNASNILDTTAVVSGATGKTLTQMPTSSYSLNAPRTYTIRLGLEF